MEVLCTPFPQARSPREREKRLSPRLPDWRSRRQISRFSGQGPAFSPACSRTLRRALCSGDDENILYKTLN